MHYYSNEPKVKSDIKTFEYELDDNQLVFKTDNGVFSKKFIDYGSRALLNSIKEPLNGKILDLGCGYGPIGIIIAKRNPTSTVVLADINERAVGLAEQNIIDNKINNAKTVLSNIYENIKENFDYILTNPPIRAGKQTVFKFIEGAYDKLVKNGQIFVVIQKKQGAPSAIKKLEDVFGNCNIINRDKGYYILNSMKK